MSDQTQRWMKRELEQLLAQRARYVQAELASHDVPQKVRHTQQRLRLDQEILGRREALHALEQHAHDTRATRHDPGLTRPRAAAGFLRHAPRSTDRAIVPLAIGACIATFTLGFVLVGGAMSPVGEASTPTMVKTPRYRPIDPPAATPPVPHQDDTVMAASARVHRR